MDNQTEAEKNYLSDFLRNPDRSYCEGRFLSLAAELVRMGYKPRIVAQAGLNVGLTQARDDGWLYYRHFVANLEELSKSLTVKLDEWAEEAEQDEAAALAASLAAVQPAGEA